MDEWGVTMVSLVVGAIVSAFASLVAVRNPPERAQRTNVDGEKVPAVLGWGILLGGLAGSLVLVWWLGSDGPCRDTSTDCSPPEAWLAFRVVGLLLLGMFMVGAWDDVKGDERPRGFSGHLGALRGGAVTGGMVKLVGGGIAGLAAMYLLDGLSSVGLFILGGACVALCANLFNLLDRAPGRAGKVWLLAAVGVAGVDPEWRLWAAATIGAVIATVPLDLRAVGMLGDAGANPMGAIVGLGLVMASGSLVVLTGIVVALLGLNLLSEKVSFSKVIETTPWLARLDHLGRK